MAPIQGLEVGSETASEELHYSLPVDRLDAVLMLEYIFLKLPVKLVFL